MSKTIDYSDKSLLDYKPKIEFVEPPIVQGKIDPIHEKDEVIEYRDTRDKIITLASNIEVLAKAVQARIDVKAKNEKVTLDKSVDAAVVASVKRLFGHENINPYEITYKQYRACKERMRKKGEELGKRTTLSNSVLEQARAKILSGEVDIGKLGTEAAKTGGLRPELDKTGQIIEPIDMEVLQAYLVRIFMNAIWDKFLYPLLSSLPIIGEILPTQLVEIPEDGYSAEELVALGIPVIGYPSPTQNNPEIPSSQ